MRHLITARQHMDPKTIFTNMQRVVQDKVALRWSITSTVVMLVLGFAFLDFSLLKWNFGLMFALAEVVLHSLLSILFGVFVATHIYKYRHATVNIKNKATGLVGWALGVLVTGCPSCSITIAAYVWLAGLFAALPFHGLETKVLGIVVLLWAEYIAVRDLLVCKLKKKN